MKYATTNAAIRVRSTRIFALINTSLAIFATCISAADLHAGEPNLSNAMALNAAQSTPVVEIAASDSTEQPLLGTIQTTTPPLAQINSPYTFKKGQRERDFSIGYGKDIRVPRFQGRTHVEMVQALPRWGRFRNARQEILWEVPMTVFTEPTTSYMGGVTLMFRQHLSKNRRFMPFVEFGPGVTLTSLKTDELGGAFQFSLQGGVGVRAALSERSDLIVGARWFHISNGGLRATNTGLSNYLITAGYSKLY